MHHFKLIRLGLLSILFEFIEEGRKVWVVGDGRNRYQFVYSQDLIDACLLGANFNGSGIFNVGSDRVKTFREVYQYVIDAVQTGARLASLPKTPALWAMKLAHIFKVSPLGPYQSRMIAEDFVFDTSKIKSSMQWAPTLTNEEVLLRAYEYYKVNKSEIQQRSDSNFSAHKQAAPMGVIRLLKWMS